MNFNFYKFLVTLPILLTYTSAFSAGRNPSSTAGGSAVPELDYPELVVTPKASERLEIEAKQEASRRWTTHWPIQLSALGTFASGILMLGSVDPVKDAGGKSPMIGISIGGGWLAVTTLMALYYEPYRSSISAVKDSKKGSGTREQLTSERLAEEALESPASLGRKLRWLSVLSNLGGSAFMLTKAESGTIGWVGCLVSSILSFTPLLFSYRWESVSDKHSEYKKKIYGPVSSLMIAPDPVAPHRLMTGLQLGFEF